MTFPVPRDIPLPLPAPEGLLEFLLIIAFLVHIVFVHLMIGGSLFSLLTQLKGLKDPVYEKLAYKIMQTVTVNKSMAVVMGVAPLLLINTLYAPQFYASSALIGGAWMAIIPLISVAFLLAYAHKFWWDRFVNIPELHIGIAALESILFLIIALIYMTNVNLMLFPELWSEVKGFFSALLLPNVLQRYLHFISAAVLFSALFFVWWSGRPSFQHDTGFAADTLNTIRRFFYAFAFGATVFQVFTGLIVFVSLPTQGMSWQLTGLLFLGGSLAFPILGWMWRNLQQTDQAIDAQFNKIVGLFLLALLIMGYARHVYRETALHDQKLAIAEKTANYQDAIAQAQQQAALQREASRQQPTEPGEYEFKQNCAACHHPTLATVGPALVEIRKEYAGDPVGISQWTKKPGKKRENSMQMPGFPQLSDEELNKISLYMLKAE